MTRNADVLLMKLLDFVRVTTARLPRLFQCSFTAAAQGVTSPAIVPQGGAEDPNIQVTSWALSRPAPGEHSLHGVGRRPRCRRLRRAGIQGVDNAPQPE